MKYRKLSEERISSIQLGAIGTCKYCSTEITLEATDNTWRSGIENRGTAGNYLVWDILCPNCKYPVECSKKK